MIKRLANICAFLLFILPLSMFAMDRGYVAPSMNGDREPVDAPNIKSHSEFDRSFNVRFIGDGIFNGFIGAAIDFQVKPNFTIGPIAKGFAFGSHDGYMLGVTSNFAFNGNAFATGWILNPYIGFYRSNYDTDNDQQKSSFLFGVNVGYQWMWSNGFNAQLGAGVFYANHEMPLTFKTGGHIYPTILASVGYAF